MVDLLPWQQQITFPKIHDSVGLTSVVLTQVEKRFEKLFNIFLLFLSQINFQDSYSKIDP